MNWGQHKTLNPNKTKTIPNKMYANSKCTYKPLFTRTSKCGFQPTNSSQFDCQLKINRTLIFSHKTLFFSVTNVFDANETRAPLLKARTQLTTRLFANFIYHRLPTNPSWFILVSVTLAANYNRQPWYNSEKPVMDII